MKKLSVESKVGRILAVRYLFGRFLYSFFCFFFFFFCFSSLVLFLISFSSRRKCVHRKGNAKILSRDGKRDESLTAVSAILDCETLTNWCFGMY